MIPCYFLGPRYHLRGRHREAARGVRYLKIGGNTSTVSYLVVKASATFSLHPNGTAKSRRSERQELAASELSANVLPKVEARPSAMRWPLA